MNIFQRIASSTPKFFKIIRNIGLTLVGIGTTVKAIDVPLPQEITDYSGILITAGTVAAAVAQSVYKTNDFKEPENDKI